MCLAFRASGLWLCYATLQNLIPSFPWIGLPHPPPWRNPKKGRDQILPSCNHGLDNQTMIPTSCMSGIVTGVGGPKIWKFCGRHKWKPPKRRTNKGQKASFTAQKFAPFILARCPSPLFPPCFKHIPAAAAKLGTSIGRALLRVEKSRSFD